MIIDISFSWVATDGSGEGKPARYRFGLDNQIRKTYEDMGRPHGNTQEGLRQFIENVIQAAVGGEGGDPFGLLDGAPRLPGYKPVIHLDIVGDSEEEIAPPDSLPAYKEGGPGIYTQEDIRERAPLSENGEKLAYVGLMCKFWAVSLEDCAPCPHNSPLCEGHCPHCGGPLMSYPLEKHLETLNSIPPASRALVLAAYAENCDTCHVSILDYETGLDGIGAKLRDHACIRAQAPEGPGRYAHLLPNAQALVPRTCPTCNGEAAAVALRAEDGEKAAWLLTWVCENRHYNHKAEGWIAPWPFAEGYATPADLAAAGFKVIK
jgi:hypothetical protein